MACTRGGEEFEPRNVLFLPFLSWFFLPLHLPHWSDSSALTSSVASPYSSSSLCPPPFLFYLCLQFQPPPIFFPSFPLSIFFLFLRRPSVYMYQSQNRGRFAAREKNKVTAQKWKKSPQKSLLPPPVYQCWGSLYIIHTSFCLFLCLFCKFEGVTFYRFTCCRPSRRMRFTINMNIKVAWPTFFEPPQQKNLHKATVK